MIRKFLVLSGASLTFNAAAISPMEFEQALAAADEVASVEARYRVCKVEDTAELKSAYMGHANKCGASEQEIQRLDKEYDDRIAFHDDELKQKKFVCPHTVDAATERKTKFAQKIKEQKC